MSWAKLDDAMCEHRKVKRTLRKSRPAIALHFLGILHCSRYLTDGFVEHEYVEEVLPPRERESALAALVEYGLWVPCDGGYTIHDYLEHNPTRAKVLAQRAADAARKAAGRNSRGKPAPVRADSERTPDGLPAESGRPVPSRPVPRNPLSPGGGISEVAPVKPKGNRKSDHDAYRSLMDEWASAHFPSAEPDAVGAAVSWLQPRTARPVTADDVRGLCASSAVWAAQLGDPKALEAA